MRFKLNLRPTKTFQKLTLQYNYPFAAWIYAKIKESDAEYAKFLHEKGYSVENSFKTFKHFTFSNLYVPHKAKAIEKGEDFILLSDKMLSVIVSFYIEKAAEDFIVGLFKNQNLSIYDKKYQSDFVIESVEALTDAPDDAIRQIFVAKSPMLIAAKQSDGSILYLDPQHPDFAKLFAQNLWSKYISIYKDHLRIDAISLENLINFRLLDSSNMKSKLRIIKKGRGEETKVRGFENFTFELKAPKEIIEIGYWGGFGKMTSSAGMGYCELVKS